MKKIHSIAGQAELDKILAAIPESDLIELCCLHADKKSTQDVLRGAYEDASFLWEQIKDRPSEDFPNALKTFVSLIKSGVDRSAAAQKFIELPMLLRWCRAFEVRNENYGGSEGFLDALDHPPEADVLSNFANLNEYLFVIESAFSKKSKMVEITKIQVARHPRSRGSKNLKSLEEVKTSEARIPFLTALRVLLPGSSKKEKSEIEARFARWNATDTRHGNNGVRDYPTEREEVEMSIAAIGDSNASARLNEWTAYGFSKADLLNVARRVFLWAEVDVPDGRKRPQKPSDTDEESKPPKEKKKPKSGKGRVRSKKHDKRLGARNLRPVKKKKGVG
jgi:hypothetical protein